MSSLGQVQNYLENLNDRLASLEQVSVSQDATEDWLQIPFRFVNIAAGANALVTRTIAGDGPFDLIEITHVAIDAAGAGNDLCRSYQKDRISLIRFFDRLLPAPRNLHRHCN